MKLDPEIRLDIQCFAYFLFRGAVGPDLVRTNPDYLDRLLVDPDALYTCFEVFVYAYQQKTDRKAKRAVADYISATGNRKDSLAMEARQWNSKQTHFWKDFLELAACFCYNTFPEPLTEEYLEGLNGCGSDGVPAFAVWTNVIELDNQLNTLNGKYALKRANERLLLWENKQPSTPFTEAELDQELY